MMSIRSMIKSVVLSEPFIRPYAAYLKRSPMHGQGDESYLLARLANQLSIAHTFVEFGFHPLEYNCASLAALGFDGLLIDGEPYTVRLAKHMLTSNVRAQCRFLTLDNLDIVRNFCAELGVLSVDVDGIDYWLLKALLPLRPAIICVEYNASFGLRPITVPYKPLFDRSKEHSSGWYHGASLTALAMLCDGYDLHAVSSVGTNAIFVRKDLGAAAASAESLYRQNDLRNQWAKNTAAEQWEQIHGLNYVTAELAMRVDAN